MELWFTFLANFAERGWIMGQLNQGPIVTHKDDFQINSQNIIIGNILRIVHSIMCLHLMLMFDHNPRYKTTMNTTSQPNPFFTKWHFFLSNNWSIYTLLRYVNDQSAYLLCSPGSLTYLCTNIIFNRGLCLFKNTMVNQKLHWQRPSLLHETVCFVIRPHYGKQTLYTHHPTIILYYIILYRRLQQRKLSRDSWPLLNLKKTFIYYEDAGVVTSWWLRQREIYVRKKSWKVHSIDPW
jgi:hypothetical protein